MLTVLVVEDNPALRQAMKMGLNASGDVEVVGEAASGEEAVGWVGCHQPEVVLMDVALAGEMNGIQAAVALRKEYPRLPVVFYSIQDDDRYYRDFLSSGILTHYAYVRKSNFLLPSSVIPLLKAARTGQDYIDPEISVRVQAVRQKDANDPLTLLEPNEQAVVCLLAQGLTNEQISLRLGYHDARAVSRTNGQIYAAWNLNVSTTDEKVARTRAALIYFRRQLLVWDADGSMVTVDMDGHLLPNS